MKKAILFFLLITTTFNYAQTNNEQERNQITIKLKDFNQNKIALQNNLFGITLLDHLNALQNLIKIEAIGNYKTTKTFLLTFNQDKDIEKLCKEYAKLQCIAYAEPNYIATAGGMEQKLELTSVPNDAFFYRQWGLYNDGTLTGVGTVENDADVDMELAWNIQTGDPNMIIAVPDSGLRMTHPDIASRIWVNPNEIAGNGIDDDANGLIDDIKGWDWVNNDNNPTDDHGHGTNVCGIIGAIPNTSLFAGVNWNSKIMPLKVLNASNSGTYAGMASSIYYAVDKGAKVISMSIGGTGISATLTNAVSYANTHNVVFVVCMMNENSNVTYYPAGYSTTYSNVIAVGATNPNDDRTAPFFWSPTSGSSFGNHINVVAPGNYIYGLSSTSDISASTYWGGTSQATPLVAGVASLMLAQNPSLTPSQVRTILQNTAEDQKGLPTEDVAGFDIYHGWGRINAYQALQQTLSNQEHESFQQEFYVVNPVINKNVELMNKGNYMGNFQVKLFSLDGKLLSDTNVNIDSAKNDIKFDNPAGIYILQIQNEKYRKTFKITMQ